MSSAVRIGRIKMKNGGADVRIIHRDPVPRIVRSIQDFANKVASYPDPPSAFAAIAFWPSDDGEPWRPPQLIRWDTIDPDLPLPRLMPVAGAAIAQAGTVVRATDATMIALGYQHDDEPEPAA